MITLEIINPLTYPAYDDMVLAAGGFFFHTSFWARVLSDSYGYRPCYLARADNGKFTTLLPLMEIRSLLTGRRGVSLPFTDYCEPIIADEDAGRDILEFLQAYGEREQWKHWELRGGERFWNKAPVSSFYYRHVLGLSTDVDALFANLKSSTKRNIEKAIREKVTITHADTLEAVKAFYRLHCLTRKKHGVPPQPFHFFQLIYDHVISRGHGQVVLAYRQGKAIAAAVCLHFGNEAIYKFGASDGNYLHLRPNDLVMWDAIQGYCRNGYKLFCFGRTEPGNEGLRQFKSGWGAEEKILNYHRYDLGKNVFVVDSPQRHGFLNRVFSGLPVPVLKLSGSLLYKHMG